MRHDGAQRVGIRKRDVGADIQLGRHAANLGQSNGLQTTQYGPADVELEAAQREARGAREGMVVVVQLLAAQQHRPWRDVGGAVVGFEVAVAPPVAEAVDDAGSGDRDHQHLQRPKGDANDAEQCDVGEQKHGRTQRRIAAVDASLQPVGRRAGPILLVDGRILACVLVQRHAVENHLVDAEDHRAVRIVLGLAVRVVLAMDRDPVLGHHGRGQPQPEAHRMRHDRMQVDATMRLATMQVDRHRKNGELRHHGEDDQQDQPVVADQAIGEPRVQGRIHRGVLVSC